MLELGCGNGRNAIYLAGQGCDVDAVDFSAQAVEWAAEGGSGLGYTEEHLRALWNREPFSVRVLRQMNQAGAEGSSFGLDFLWVLLAEKGEEVAGRIVRE